MGEVRDVVLDAATRLWLLIEKLLDLSLLQAGRLEPGAAWCSIEEVLHEAVEQTGAAMSSSRCRSTVTCRRCAATRPSWSGRS